MGKVELGEQLTEQVNAHIQQLQAELAEGHTRQYLESLDFYSRFTRYSWGNSLLIAQQCPHATLVAGYKKWVELGFQVKSGERGLKIRAPWLRKEENPAGVIEERLIGYFATYVFDITQTEEYPAKQPPSQFQDVPGDYADLYAHLVAQVQANGVKFEELPLQLGLHGYCEPTIRRIVVNQNLAPYLKITCLVHEYVHQIAHADLRRRKELTKQEREFEAESVAYVVCKAIGVENINSRDYLLGEKLTTEKLAEMIQFIQRTTKQVLKDLDLLQPVKLAVMAAD